MLVIVQTSQNSFYWVDPLVLTWFTGSTVLGMFQNVRCTVPAVPVSTIMDVQVSCLHCKASDVGHVHTFIII